MQFEKVSLKTASRKFVYYLDPDVHFYGEEELERDMILPSRSTYNAAGYDFFSPFNLRFEPGKSILIPTGVKCRLDTGYFLMIVPRSSVGIKKNLMLKNTIGIVDADYYNNPENEGMIYIALYNYGNKTEEIKKYERFAQGIILPYATVTFESFENVQERKGGIGSTGN